MENIPVYVKIEDYKDIVEILSLIREKINQAKHTLDKINELKAQEDDVLAEWGKKIDDVEHRVEEVDKTLLHNK